MIAASGSQAITERAREHGSLRFTGPDRLEGEFDIDRITVCRKGILRAHRKRVEAANANRRN